MTKKNKPKLTSNEKIKQRVKAHLKTTETIAEVREDYYTDNTSTTKARITSSRKKLKGEKVNIKTTIYLTFMFVLFALQLYLGTLTVATGTYIVILTTIPYLFFTKKYYIIQPFIAIFFLMIVIATLPTSIYMITGKEPSFIVSSSILGFFITLLIGNIVSHAEWSIRSPWIANILGLLSLYLVEFTLATGLLVKNSFIIGGSGLIALVSVSCLYLMVGKYIHVNKPTTMQDNSQYLQLTERLLSSGYEQGPDLKRSEGQLLLLDTLSKNTQYRLAPIDSALTVTTEKKNYIKNYYLWKNGVRQQVYSWLLREGSKSKEQNLPKGIKAELFIVINQKAGLTDGFGDIIEIPLKRSNKNIYVGKFTLGDKVTSKTVDNFNELAVALKLKNDGL